MRPYFLTGLFLSLVGSITLSSEWIITDFLSGDYQNDMPFTGWDFYLFVIFISFFLGLIFSYPAMLFLWLMEARKGNKFFLYYHLIIFLFFSLISIYYEIDWNQYIRGFAYYYLPGILGYYIFVQRKRIKIN
jgi:hypothetical protein